MKIVIVGVFNVKGSTNIFAAKALRELGHEVVEFDYRYYEAFLGPEPTNLCLLYEVIKVRPDFVLIFKGEVLDAGIIRQINKFTRTFYFYMDPIASTQPRFLEVARACTYCSCTGGGVAEFFKKNGVSNPIQIMEGVDPDFYHPVEKDDLYEANISFIGSRTPERDRYLFPLGGAIFPARVYGPSYGPTITGDEFNKVCSSSKIMLSINTQNDIMDYFSDRVFLYLAAKSFVLQLYSPGLENYFTNGKHLVWFRDVDELIELVKYYLPEEMEEERGKIAEAGYQYVLQNYLWTQSVTKILGVVNE